VARADLELGLIGLPDAKHPTLKFGWQQLPEETREAVTWLVMRLLVDHQRRGRRSSASGRRGDV
jgi:hypothetical protein